MPFIVPSFLDIRDALLRDIKNQLPDADIGSDSDYFVRASSVASAAEGLYQHQAWMTLQIFPDTADTDYLELHARVRGLKRKAATVAAGHIRVSGTPGAQLPPGLSVKINTFLYLTTEAAVIDSNGVAQVALMATEAGVAGNVDANVEATLMSAPSGVASKASVVDMTGGTQTETDAALLARLLELIRRPPAGGNKYDYRRWAMEVEGVTDAYVYPLRRGLGTVDVAITSAGELPSANTVTAVQAHIDDVRPVTASDVFVFPPEEVHVPVAVKVQISGVSIEEIRSQIRAALTEYFNGLAPHESAVKSRMEAIVSDLPGVLDRVMTAPASNVAPQDKANTVQWLRLGTVTVEEIIVEKKP